MKKKILIIAMLMMCLAVQGYAQGRHEHQRGQRTEQRREYGNSSRRSGYSRSGANATRQHRDGLASSRNPQRSRDSYRSNSTNRNNYGNRSHQPRRNNYDNRGYQPRHTPPPRHYGSSYRYRPTPPPPRYHHHHGYYHHHHHCYFNDWYWYNWGGYHNRFICHRHYHNRFFDSMLGYYLWGALNAPTRLDIGNLSLTRYNNMLKIQVGAQCSYMDLYTLQTVQYQVGNTVVNISTGSGYATVRFYDDYGNEAVYSL